jgi:hypothetical protein
VVADKGGLEDYKKGYANLPFLFALPLTVLQPDGRLLHVETDVYTEDSRQNAEPEKAAPADHIEKRPVGGAGERGLKVE